ncbi:hypothetical protein [Nonomuraea sp. NPDC049709]|uniref:hypothetical protein n=1 Tax=Nonomuraea sp. NPDC049709 TaxID=3154736 RepID=UPI0034135763
MSIAYRLEESPDVRSFPLEGDPVTGLARRTADLLRSGDPRAEGCLRALADTLAAGDHLAVRLAMEAIGVRLAAQAGRLPATGPAVEDGPAGETAQAGCGVERAPAGGTVQVEPAVMGCRWRISFGGRAALVDDGLGMRSLAVLIANPGRAMDAVDLAARPPLPDEPARGGGASSLPPPDDRASHLYREHLSWLQAEIDDLESAGVTWRTAACRAEHDRLAATFAAAARGDTRPAADQELVGIAVGRAIQRTLTRIADPVIAGELRATVRIGARCSYRPRRA